MEECRSIFIRNLKKYMGLNQMNQVELASKLKINKSVVSSWMNGARYPHMNTIERIAAIFRIEKSDLIEDKNLTSQGARGIRIPVLGSVIAGQPAYAAENIIGWEEVTAKMSKQGKLFALKVRGESMVPEFKEGDIVIVKEQPDVESGEIAVVLINGDEGTLKKVKKTADGIFLYAFNPAVYEPHFYSNADIENLPVRIVGKVIENRREW